MKKVKTIILTFGMAFVLGGCLGFGDPPTTGDTIASCWAGAKSYEEMMECEVKFNPTSVPKSKDGSGMAKGHNEANDTNRNVSRV